MGWSVARSSKISFETFRWPSVRVKGSLASKASRMPSGTASGDGGQLGVGVPAAGEGDLEDEGLVPLEPVPGGGDVGLGAGPVDHPQGVGQFGEAAALAQGVRERVDGVGDARQDRVDGLGDLPGLQLGGGRVDRDEGPGPDVHGLLAVAAQEFVRRVGELEAPVEERDLAREHRAGAGQQVLVRLVHALAEEDELHAAAAVGDGHFEALAAPLGAVEGEHTGVGDLRDHRDVLVERQVGEGG